MPEGDRYQAEIENQKITAAWNAMRSVSNDPFSVTWGDFMLTQQVMQLWRGAIQRRHTASKKSSSLEAHVPSSTNVTTFPD